MNKRNGYLISKALHTSNAKVEWSLEPFIPNKRGGKIPMYVKL
jgi:hypothetical protein